MTECKSYNFGFKKGSFRWVLFSEKAVQKSCKPYAPYYFSSWKIPFWKKTSSFLSSFYCIKTAAPQAYLEPSLLAINYFHKKSSIVEVRLGSKYVSDLRLLKFLLIPKQWLN